MSHTRKSMITTEKVGRSRPRGQAGPQFRANQAPFHCRQIFMIDQSETQSPLPLSHQLAATHIKHRTGNITGVVRG